MLKVLATPQKKGGSGNVNPVVSGGGGVHNTFWTVGNWNLVVVGLQKFQPYFGTYIQLVR